MDGYRKLSPFLHPPRKSALGIQIPHGSVPHYRITCLDIIHIIFIQSPKWHDVFGFVGGYLFVLIRTTMFDSLGKPVTVAQNFGFDQNII